MNHLLFINDFPSFYSNELDGFRWDILWKVSKLIKSISI